MLLNSPLDKPSKELVIGFLNKINGTDFSPDFFTWSNPVVLSNDVNNDNTQITLTSNYPGQAAGSFNFRYNRVNLTDLYNSAVIKVRIRDYCATTGSLITDINNVLGTFFSIDDIVDESLASTNYPYVQTFNCKENSYILIGSFDVEILPKIVIADPTYSPNTYAITKSYPIQTFP